MDSDNLSGADNQQERPGSTAWLDAVPPDVGHYIAGFVDGEGSFNVPIRRSGDRGLPWRVALSFNVSQVGADAPEFLRSVFGVGTVRGRGDGVFYYEVTKPSDIVERFFRSSIDSGCEALSVRIWPSLVRSRSLFSPAGTCASRASSRFSPCEVR